MSHSLPNPAYLDRCSVSQQLGALQTHTTDTFLFISHTSNVPLFKFHCNIFIGVRIIEEMPGSVASGTPCIIYMKSWWIIHANGHKIDYEWTTKQSQVRTWKQSERRKRQATKEEARDVPMKMELAWHGSYVVSCGFIH
jgi:hypothetical protein